MIIFQKNKKFIEFNYNSEEEFETEVFSNRKQFFGSNTILIDAKKKIDTKELGSSIPDGFLFDLNDMDSPEFYLVEVELASHDFFKHIFPQITKFFAFYKNNKNLQNLVEKIFKLITNSNDLKRTFKKYLGNQELYKFIKDTIENSQNILLVLDAPKNELPEIIDTYTDTWGKIVKVLVITKFHNKKDFIYAMDPEFENVEYALTKSASEAMDEETKEISEEYHLKAIDSNVKNIYFNLKDSISKLHKDIVFNPQRYYISIRQFKNIAFFKFRRKKIRLVIMLPFDIVKEKIKSYPVKTLSESVQKFYNGPSCAIDIINIKHLREIIELFKHDLIIAD